VTGTFIKTGLQLLVAKRWRRKSQRRVLSTISFSSEYKMNRWCTDIPRDSDGISSYVRHVEIQDIDCWDEPALFSRILGTLSSLTTLSMYTIDIPDELPGHISRREVGKGVTALRICYTSCTPATMTHQQNVRELILTLFLFSTFFRFFSLFSE
jgi:hypothetical protein